MSNIFGVTEKKYNALRERMAALDVEEKDLTENFGLGSGRGGQKKNKTNVSVRLKHTPTEVEVKTAKHRSQSLNRYEARKLLCSRLEEDQGLSKKDEKAAKIRKQKSRRKRRSSSKN